MILYYALMILLLAAAAADIIRLRIPNAVCAAIATLFLLPAVFHSSDLHLIGHLGASALVLLVGWGLFLLGVMGGGDVKLFAATALWTGLDLLTLQFVYTSLLGLALVAALVSLRYLIQISTVRLRIIQGATLPPSLVPGEGAPYGVAISAATILLMDRMSPALWLP